MRVLIVEDDPDLREGWIELFDFLGHEARVRRTQLLRALQSARSLGEGGSVQALCLECAASSGLKPSAGPGSGAASDVGFLASLLRILQ